MPTAPPSITTLPAAPDPNNRTTFNSLAYPWSAALPTFGTQVSAVATNVKANADEAEADAVATAADRVVTTADRIAAAASASTATTQADLATTNGAAQVALATTQAGNALTSANNAAASAAVASGAAAFVDTNPVVKGSADATKQVRFEVDGLTTGTTRVLTVPDKDGTLAMTSDILPSTGGATITSSAVDVTLTSASNRVQSLAMTTAAKSVTLPDATTLTKGGALFVVKNTGALNYAVRANGGVLLANLAPGQTAVFYLTDNATSAGGWAVGDESTGTAFSAPLPGTVNTLNAVSSNFMTLVSLSSTVTIAAYNNGTNLVARVLTITGNSISAGAEATVNTSGTQSSLTMLTATTALIMFSDASVASYPTSAVLTVSGTTITIGAKLTISAAASSSSNSVSANSATVALATYRGASGYPCARVLTISGTTVTAGAELIINTVGADFAAVRALTATTGVAVYYGTSGYLYGKVLTISGAAVTAGAALTITSVLVPEGVLSELTSTTALVAYRNNTSGFLESRVLTVSGTTLTTSASTSLGYVSLTPALAPITAGGWLGHLDPSNYPSLVKANVDLGTVSFGSKTIVNAATSTTLAVAAPSANSLVMLYRGTSSYAQAVVLEFAP